MVRMKMFSDKYEGTIGSDLERDGMYLEVTDSRNSADAYLEIFYSDETNKFSLTLFKESVELELIEEAIEIAKLRLVPVS